MSKYPGGFSPFGVGPDTIRVPGTKQIAGHVHELIQKASNIDQRSTSVKVWALRCHMLLLQLSLNLPPDSSTEKLYVDLTSIVTFNDGDESDTLDLLLRSVDVWESLVVSDEESSALLRSLISEGMRILVIKSSPLREEVMITALDSDLVHDAG